MRRELGELYAKAEIAMMGRVVEINDKEVDEFTRYITKSLGYEPIVASAFGEINKYDANNCNSVKFATVSLVAGMPCITYLLAYRFKEGDPEYDWEYDYEEPIVGKEYSTAFCYVLNLVEPMFSEFGTCGFENMRRKY